MFTRDCIVAALLLAVAPVALADTAYKWVDEQGNVHYQDAPPPDDALAVEEKQITDVPVTGDEGEAPAPVTLYSISECVTCDEARGYLTKRQVQFIEKNVEGDEELQRELREKSGALKVPVIAVGDDIIQGFDREAVGKALEAGGYPGPPAPQPQPDTTPEPEPAPPAY